MDISIRIKPSHSCGSISVQDSFININDKSTVKLGPQKNVFDTSKSQQSIQNHTIHIASSKFIQGISCTIFMQGQTGSGKTHTLFGPPKFFDKDPADWGLCPRFLQYIVSEHSDMLISMTVGEVQLNDVFDLLNNKVRIKVSGSAKNSLKPGQDVTEFDANGKWKCPHIDDKPSVRRETKLSGLKSIEIHSQKDVLDMMRLIESNRTTKSHAINERSSRSHCLVEVKGMRKSNGKVINASFTFVDLAGSERVEKTGVNNIIQDPQNGPSRDLRAEEAKVINVSLTALHSCIDALSKNRKIIPYRESVLTSFLKKSLSGNCYTNLIVTIAEDPSMLGESISSLRFAMISNKVKKDQNQVAEVQDAQDHSKSLLKDINQVKNQLAILDKSNSGGGINPDFPKPTVNGFMENFRKQKCQLDANTELSINKTNFKQDATQLNNKQKILNLKGILVRQMTTGILITPTKHQLQLKKELYSLEDQQCKLDRQYVKTSRTMLDDMLLELDVSNMIVEFGNM